jgi:outer membrane protein TolC
MKMSTGRLVWCGALSFWLGLAGCTTNYYRNSADKETYGLIKEKTPQVRDMDPAFTIEQTNAISLGGLQVATNVYDFLGPTGEREQDARVLTLEDALGIAVRHSRNYQSRKEQLYLSGLSLTQIRHDFAPIFSAVGNTDYSVQTEQATTVGIDEITGEPTVIVSDTLVEQQRVGASGTINASWLIRDVGRISTAFTADFLRFITGDRTIATSSQLSATFLRPLLRDAGFKQQTEVLIQAERQLLYDLRDFTQFRKDFSVQIATAYYNVLGNRDTVRNSFLNLQSSRKNAERTRALAQEGRITQSDLGRLEQQELSAESVWINAIRSYRQALDNFKIQLGLTVDENIVLDDRELEALRIHHPEITVDDSIRVALAARLDYMNTKDELDDSVRKVDLAVNLLKPRVDLSASVVVNSDPNDNTGFPVPDFDRYRWNAGLTIDPGLDRKSERNVYRAALISRNRAARAVEQQEDEIKLQVRDSWRTLDQAKRNYEISEIGVKLAERRVEEQNLLAELGRAKAQDQVDSQNDLINSKNQLTQALVTHTIARLQFWNNMGILYIKDNGQWEEVQDARIQ